MTARLRLPRMLSHSVRGGLNHNVGGETVRDAIESLFEQEPGLRTHLVDEQGELRPHVSVFVDGIQADLSTPVPEGADMRVLHAVSGGD